MRDTREQIARGVILGIAHNANLSAISDDLPVFRYGFFRIIRAFRVACALYSILNFHLRQGNLK